MCGLNLYAYYTLNYLLEDRKNQKCGSRLLYFFTKLSLESKQNSNTKEDDGFYFILTIACGSARVYVCYRSK